MGGGGAGGGGGNGQEQQSSLLLLRGTHVALDALGRLVGIALQAKLILALHAGAVLLEHPGGRGNVLVRNVLGRLALDAPAGQAGCVLACLWPLLMLQGMVLTGQIGNPAHSTCVLCTRTAVAPSQPAGTEHQQAATS